MGFIVHVRYEHRLGEGKEVSQQLSARKMFQAESRAKETTLDKEVKRKQGDQHGWS
jgi:hypothetical protein